MPSALIRQVGSRVRPPGRVDGARSLTQARFGALAIFDPSGAIETFVTSGIAQAKPERIGDLLIGLVSLGRVRLEHMPVGLADLTSHRALVGFPYGHPPTMLDLPRALEGGHTRPSGAQGSYTADV